MQVIYLKEKNFSKSEQMSPLVLDISVPNSLRLIFRHFLVLNLVNVATMALRSLHRDSIAIGREIVSKHVISSHTTTRPLRQIYRCTTAKVSGSTTVGTRPKE